MHAEALVDAGPERQVGLRLPVRVPHVGVLDVCLVAIGRAHQGEDARTLGDGTSGDVDIRRGLSIDHRHRRLPPQRLFDDVGDQSAVGDDLGQHVGLG